MQHKASCTLLILLASLSAPSARAVTLDWDAVSWTAGSLNNSYDIDPLFAGNDVTIAVTGDTTQPVPLAVYPGSGQQSPTRTTGFQGGLGTAENTLAFGLDLQNQSQFITITVDFSALYAQGVQNVSFSLFDVDFNNADGSNFQDQLRSITATSIGGAPIAPTITPGSSNTLTGAGLTQVVTGNASVSDTGGTSGNGNVTISFGSNAIRSFTFTYGSGSSTTADPAYQHIGLHDISFTPVPEVNPALMSVFSCMAAAGLILRHRASVRK